MKKLESEDFFFRDHYVFTTLTQIYLGHSHLCKSLFLAILGRRKKGLRNIGLRATTQSPMSIEIGPKMFALVVRTQTWLRHASCLKKTQLVDILKVIAFLH